MLKHKIKKQTLMTDKKTHEVKENYGVDNAMGIVMEEQANLSDDDSSMEKKLDLFGKVITELIIISTFGELIMLFFKKFESSLNSSSQDWGPIKLIRKMTKLSMNLILHFPKQ
uniref:Uncharacterized protein n=1 Tax=Opuntia streptacantha TaxID=393608 RepID=A0A7C9DPM8_OPUST